jgi:hypothetical protein
MGVDVLQVSDGGNGQVTKGIAQAYSNSHFD